MNRVAAHLTSLFYVLGGRLERAQERRDRGATAVEYGLLVGLIAIAIVVAITALGGQLSALFTSVGAKLPKA